MPPLHVDPQNTSENRTTSLWVAMGLSDPSHSIPPAWITESIKSVALNWPLVILAKLWGALLLVDPDSFLVSGQIAQSVGLAGFALIIDSLIYRAPRLPGVRDLPPHTQLRILLLLATVSAASYSIWVGTLPSNPLSQTTSGTAILAGTLVIAFSIFGGHRIVGFCYSVGTGATAVLLSGSFVYLGPIALYAGILGLIAMRQARIDERNRVARVTAETRGSRAERLLLEHERSGRGWFWETDRQGRLTYISESLAHTIGHKSVDLLGRPITDLVNNTDKQKGDGERTLGFHLSTRSAFSDVAVRAAMASDERWWSISGQPIINSFGQFHGFRGSGTDLTEMRRSQAEVSRLAEFDSLTGLANRVQMMRTLEQAVVGTRGQAGDCALLLLDLDRFKSVNDTLGHPAGDQLLRLVAQRLLRVVGDEGRVGRLGGDEFKIVLPGIFDKPALAALADRIIDTLSVPYTIGSSQVVIGASVGISLCPDDGVTPEAMIRNADLALYAAKGDGRGVHRFYSSEMHADAEDRRRLEEDLRGALAADALSLVYQPVVSALTEKVTGFEALLRWEHPIRGQISPTIFVPIAEDAGLISQIGEWVLRTACRDASAWPEGIRVAVNVSPTQFANPALPSIVVSALAASGLAPERLELEITESVFLNDDSETDAMFRRLKGVGVRLALDDFGTGYSSLGYLKSAPFDKIKIDQSFVRGAAMDGNRNSAIIKAIVSLADALDMETTAEGAETHDELELIRRLGCSHIQGFIYGRPISATDVIVRLGTQGVHAERDGYRSSRPPRKTLLRLVNVTHGGHRYAGRIRNISSTGALIEGLWNVPVDTLFQVELAEGYVVDAVSRWSVDNRMGVKFAAAIDIARLLAQPVPRALAS